MNCPACQRQLTAYIDDEVTAELRLDIEAHLDDCSGCRREFDTYQAAFEVTTSSPNEGPRRDLWEGIAAKLEPGGATNEDLALMIRGLARQVESLEREVAALRVGIEEEEEHSADQGWSRSDIKVRSKLFSTRKVRPASTPATIEQLRKSS